MNDATYATFSRAIHERHFGKRTPCDFDDLVDVAGKN